MSTPIGEVPAIRQDYWDFSKPGVRWDELNQLSLISLDPTMSPSDAARLRRYRELWNHYEGFHWENIPNEDRPQVTLNYCRRFVDKFTSFLFGLYDEKEGGFTIKVPTEMEQITLPFLNSVWDAEYNDRRKIALQLGQIGGVTGDVYLLIRFEEPGRDYVDAFNEYPDGRIRIRVLPSHIVFPIYDPADPDNMVACEIKYPIARREEAGFFAGFRNSVRTMFGRNPRAYRTVVYRQRWTREYFQEWEGDELVNEGPNPYGEIPIVHIRNLICMTSNFGVSDIEDVIPVNKEINFKMSDNSEIIDYHSAPVTLVFGAKVGQLERGANKIWGNLPKDARVENLQLSGDLSASVTHIKELKTSMFEIGGMPTHALGGEVAISNTSGVALQIQNMPLIEKTGWKRITYGNGIRKACRLILLVGFKHGLIEIPTQIRGKGVINAVGNDIPDSTTGGASATASSVDTNASISEDTIVTDYTTICRLFYDVAIQFPNPLPKDRLLELEQIQVEMNMQLENRVGALKRLGRENIEQKLAEIDREKDMMAAAEARRAAMIISMGGTPPKSSRSKSPIIVSGFNNGPEPKSDMLRDAEKEIEERLSRPIV